MNSFRFAAAALLGAIISVPGAMAQTPVLESTNWLSYNKNINGQRYAPLEQINRDNANQLGEVCTLNVEKLGAFHTSILHVDGMLYFTTSTDTLAVDSTNCKLRWRHHYVEQEPDITTLRVNRGVAYANGRVFRGTVDSRLLAIDAKTGETIWQHQVGDPSIGEFFSASPQVYQGLVIMGAAGGDWGIRGRVMAFDAETGREVWRFYTIPRGDEPGADSWVVADSARFGGGGTWTTYTIDISAGEVFVPVGNPAPDLLPGQRPGENLYTDSLVVLDAATGRIKWYHQLIGNDSQDLDLGAAPVLYHNDDGDRMVAFGSKDGYVYGVNRETKQRVFKTQVTTIKNAGVVPTTEGIEVCPGPLGGVEWNGPAFDKPNRALLVGSVDWCATLAAQPEDYVYKPGQFSFGGSFTFADEAGGWVHSINADTGSIRWKLETKGPHVAGITPTAGGVAFTGDLGSNFYAIDTENGKKLYEAKTSGGLAGGVITYMRGAKQYVAFVSGNVSRLTFGNTGSPTLNIYALGGTQPAPAKPVAAAPAAVSSTNTLTGKITYAQVCAMCHGGQGEGGTGPELAGISQRLDQKRIVEWIKNPSSKMPKLFPAMLDEQQVLDVAAYLEKL